MTAGPSGSWKTAFSNVPPLTKTFATAMTIMTAVDFALQFRDFISDYENRVFPSIDSEAALIPILALVPLTAPYRFWTFASASFFERGILEFVINTLVFLGSGKYLERAWGSRVFFKFLCVSSIGPMLGVYITCMLSYMIHGREEILYETQVYGLAGVKAGFLIAFKHLIPEHELRLLGLFSIRVNSLPLMSAIFIAIDCFFNQGWIRIQLVFYGLFISWIYLRFFCVQDGIRGDRSESFSFASFFPGFVQPPIKAFSNMCFGVLVKLRICSPTFGGVRYDLENPQMTGMGLTFTQPGTLRAEAERRRAMALKALDMRLQAATGIRNSTFSGPGRAAGSSHSAPVSLLSLSAGPLPTTADEDEDEVLFEVSVIDTREAASSSPPPPYPSVHPSGEPTNETKSDKERS